MLSGRTSALLELLTIQLRLDINIGNLVLDALVLEVVELALGSGTEYHWKGEARPLKHVEQGPSESAHSSQQVSK